MNRQFSIIKSSLPLSSSLSFKPLSPFDQTTTKPSPPSSALFPNAGGRRTALAKPPSSKNPFPSSQTLLPSFGSENLEPVGLFSSGMSFTNGIPTVATLATNSSSSLSSCWLLDVDFMAEGGQHPNLFPSISQFSYGWADHRRLCWLHYLNPPTPAMLRRATPAPFFIWPPSQGGPCSTKQKDGKRKKRKKEEERKKKIKKRREEKRVRREKRRGRLREKI